MRSRVGYRGVLPRGTVLQHMCVCRADVGRGREGGGGGGGGVIARFSYRAVRLAGERGLQLHLGVHGHVQGQRADEHLPHV